MRSFDDITELEFEGSDETSETFDEMSELDLATSLLEVNDEQELDRFLTSLVKTVSRSSSSGLSPDGMRALRDLLKKAAKKAVPFAAGADSGVGGAGVKSAGEIFGLELEGLSAEDQEFEVARRFVRFARGAVRSAAAGGRRGNPAAAARGGLVRAASKLAPGLLRRRRRTSTGGAGRGAPVLGEPIVKVRGGGQWFRRGRHIIIVNCGGAGAADASGATDAAGSASSQAEPAQDSEPPDTAATGAAGGAANGAANGAAAEPSLDEF